MSVSRRLAAALSRSVATASALLFASALLTAAGAPAAASAASEAQEGCSVDYATAAQWPGGFTTNVTIRNLGSEVNGWSLTWSFTAGQGVDHAWNAAVTQNGSQVVARDAGHNARIPAGGSVSFGFNGTTSGTTTPPPTIFSLNGTNCTGGTTPQPPDGSLPNSFQWSSTGPIISPKPDSGHPAVSVKDPSVVYHDGRWHVFATVYTDGYNMVYTSFSDWSQASSAPHHYLDQSGIGPGYRAAPQVFYFAPQGLWYLVYQTGAGGSYSTTTDITRPETWSAPRNFYSAMPEIIRDNIGDGYWVDFWTVCDAAMCYLFSSDDNGHLYRSETTVANFPAGFTNTVIAMEDADRNRLFEAANVYRIQGDQGYLLVHEAIGSDGRRWFRSWTAPAITGPWTALADSESRPFARANNVTFPGGQWSRDISHGEMLRSGVDQTMEISPCDLRYLYQGLDPGAGGDYNRLPWRLGLLTQTNSPC
ncbi:MULTISPECIES: non-reducing end alpha-L-arabinofuranosidase family hydrolase [Actinoalloteichus]|uniref:non-reducing end alpha-L-arabinofuranosidase n=1 Tax=Actinoalloteichus fjordicus TaxID=1612552 RepID=A0AAC9PT30_9PSEU|nr:MULTISPECIES: non-reducing end alpha-L-arabinofuranosidase family hydrolase [Actinoalloteichus]APU15441.1 putative cellulose binding protein [Actinoalloteichus fjordicus]APU21509.1 putative cellulose binding protein [Actinoalloteichus sp. GBA129-24]